MKCYARWTKTDNCFFRDQTILQFGDSWELIANIILLNPGSATPKSDRTIDHLLYSKNLPYFIKSGKYQNYYEFKLDPLMRNIINCFKNTYSGGVIKIYNLFNLKNQNSKEAILEYKQNIDSSYIHTSKEDIIYNGKKVIVATGESNLIDELKIELKKFIQLSNQYNLIALQKISDKQFAFVNTSVDQNGLVKSFHPSYTFAYGNKTLCHKM